ncbi:sugar phosphate isomerase/epimerase family protein [Flagellimonas onchidii]|uniref:sugar phosphate isomerase/epimerase family protein n=1 Tax=Flagellimonas onchidii TaxID=2562684 RepID=UPI0010A6A63F|nr:TIM barrel protein [Allomuricauda onchidii]
MASSAIPLSVSGISLETKRKYKMGLQLFTIRDAMEKDPIGSLKTVQNLGYQDLEIYGYDGEKDTYYGYKTSDFKKILEDHNLTTSSGHYGLMNFFDKPESDLIRYVDQCIEGAHKLKQDFITWPWLDSMYRNKDGFKTLAEKLNRIGERVIQSGLRFAYHNHGFEFEDLGGENGYDIIISGTDPFLVKLQIDLYWVMHSAQKSPIEIIAEQPERFVMWHIKDMDKVTQDYSELGNGSIDYVKMLPELDKSGLEFYYLEQGGNFAHNSIQSITHSANYFKRNLKKFL